jgi:hypothetical protein
MSQVHHLTLSCFVIYSLKHERLEVTQLTAQEDQFEVSDPATLKEEFLKNLKTLILFYTRLVLLTWTNNKRKKRYTSFFFSP